MCGNSILSYVQLAGVHVPLILIFMYKHGIAEGLERGCIWGKAGGALPLPHDYLHRHTHAHY